MNVATTALDVFEGLQSAHEVAMRPIGGRSEMEDCDQSHHIQFLHTQHEERSETACCSYICRAAENAKDSRMRGVRARLVCS